MLVCVCVIVCVFVCACVYLCVSVCACVCVLEGKEAGRGSRTSVRSRFFMGRSGWPGLDRFGGATPISISR